MCRQFLQLCRKNLGVRFNIINQKSDLGIKKRLPSEVFSPILMVGATGFEPATSWSRTKRATKLRYAPTQRLL